ncbi:MAG: hypothetical protein ABFS37_10920 [Acidobacteriota bacterium]
MLISLIDHTTGAPSDHAAAQHEGHPEPDLPDHAEANEHPLQRDVLFIVTMRAGRPALPPQD